MSVTSCVRRAALVVGVALGASFSSSCAASNGPALTATERSAIADTLRTLIVNAYDLSRPGDAVARLLSLYPASGSVVSASGGQVSTSRDSIEIALRTFWENVGKNMRDPKWQWGEMHIDVLAHDAAVVTTTYRVPHLTPRGEAHVFAGAWTAVFQRRTGRWVIVQEHLSDVPAATAMAHGS
ncbi:MAG: YybH family protein [Gemmatimonadaceae bacterium]